MASGNVSRRSKNDSLGASNDKLEVGTRPRSGAPPQTDLKVKYFYNVDGKTLWAGPAVLVGALGRYRFSFDVPTSNVSFEAPNESFFDRLDTFPDAIDPRNTLRHFLLSVGGYKPDISGTGKI